MTLFGSKLTFLVYEHIGVVGVGQDRREERGGSVFLLSFQHWEMDGVVLHFEEEIIPGSPPPVILLPVHVLWFAYENEAGLRSWRCE